VTQLLIEKGKADLKARVKDKGQTPLHYACSEGKVSMVGLVIHGLNYLRSIAVILFVA